MRDRWIAIDADSGYASSGKIDPDGNGKFFITPVSLDWRLPFSLDFGQMLYQLRGALDSCVYDAAILKFGQDPPPDKTKWNFPVCPDAAEFDNAMKKMPKISDDVRALIESVQPDTTTGVLCEGNRYLIGKTLAILNDWARIDRHRRLHLVGTAWAQGSLQIIVPPPMTVEWCRFISRITTLEDKNEVAQFKIANYISGTKPNVHCKFSFKILVDEVPRVDFNEITTAMMLSVMAIREIFEKHFGLEGQQYDLSAER